MRSTTRATCSPAAPVNDRRSASRASSSAAGQPEAGVAGQAVEQLVAAGAALLAHGEGDGDGVLLDRLVGHLAPDAALHRGDQHLGGGEERQVAVELGGDHRRVGAELVEHGRGTSGTGRRRRGRRRAAPPAARPSTLTSPSFHWSPASSATIERWPRSTTARPLTRSQLRLFILWGIAELPTWPGLEALGDQLVAGHQPDRGGQARRARRRPAPGRRRRRGRGCGGTPGRRSRAPARSRGGGRPPPRARRAWSTSPPSRSSWSWAVPIGPLMPRSG